MGFGKVQGGNLLVGVRTHSLSTAPTALEPAPSGAAPLAKLASGRSIALRLLLASAGWSAHHAAALRKQYNQVIKFIPAATQPPSDALTARRLCLALDLLEW